MMTSRPTFDRVPTSLYSLLRTSWSLAVLFQLLRFDIVRGLCLTVGDGKNPGKPCIFPFVFDDETYYGCPPDLVDPKQTWCSTKVDHLGVHVPGQGEYGFCSPGCPKHDGGLCMTTSTGPKKGAKCVFPFTYDGVTYYGCPVDILDPSKRWCSTKVDVHGVHVSSEGEYGHCGVGCPIQSGDGYPKPVVSASDNFGPMQGGDGGSGYPKPRVTPSESKNALRRPCRGGKRCRPAVACGMHLTEIERSGSGCLLEDHSGLFGLCCKDITSSNPSRANPILGRGAVPVASDVASGGRRRTLGQEGITQEAFSKAVNLGMAFSSNVTAMASRMGTVGHGTAEYSHFRFQRQSEGVDVRASLAMTAMFMAKQFQGISGGLRSGEAAAYTVSEADKAGTVFEEQCPQDPECHDNMMGLRTIEGHCNNLEHPQYGRSFTPLQRILPNAYSDGLQAPRQAKSGQALPSARVVTNRVVLQNEVPNHEFTSMLMAFGQFLDHDLDHVPVHKAADGEGIQCCPPEDGGPPEGRDHLADEVAALCFPIEIPADDEVLQGKRRCINVVRSLPAPNKDCSPGPFEQVNPWQPYLTRTAVQVNQVTHWLDSSNVYGSLDQVAKSVREFNFGLLRTTVNQHGEEFLPVDPKETCRGPSGMCQLAGDLRVNEIPTLGAMHTLFLREHNRIARELRRLNPHQDDEALYQTSKRVLNAQWQHVVYNEFLPALLGPRYVGAFGLRPLTKGYSRDYRTDFDPSITNSFAVAAFRIGHTFIASTIRVVFETLQRSGPSSDEVTGTRNLDLKGFFNNGDFIKENGAMDGILKGLTLQPAEEFDNSFAEDIVNGLFDDGEFGLDLVAINIQRGRDHGIPGYVEFRDICGVGKVADFDDLHSNIRPEMVERLRSVYEHVEDIDLFIGMVMETPREGNLIGDTFICLIGDTFARLKKGDRYFYDLGGQGGSFTERQLDEIRKTSLARIICDNSRTIAEVQPLVLLLPHPTTNPITSCHAEPSWAGGIPRPDLSVFREFRQVQGTR